MVWTSKPPGASSTVANSLRALSISSTATSLPDKSSNSFAKSASSITAQRDSRPAIRVAISAAAALVKVRHRIRSARAPDNNSRSTRSVNTLVLPDPAEAATHTDCSGAEAIRWAAWATLATDPAELSGISPLMKTIP